MTFLLTDLFQKNIRRTAVWFAWTFIRSQKSKLVAACSVLLLLSACGSGGGGTTGGITTITGSGGDGPIIGGAVTVTDANGATVTTTPISPVTDSTAHYSFTLLSNTPLPLTVTIKNGMDSVTAALQDFNLTAVETAALPIGGTVVLNINPVTTLVVASALANGPLNAANLASATTNVLNTVGFGLPVTGFDPASTKVDATNIASVIKANEAVAELIRRVGVSTGKTMPNTIKAIAEDVTDGVLDGKTAVGITATQTDAKTAGVIFTKQAEIAAELLSNRLKITDKTGATKVTAAQSEAELNTAILLTQPTVTGDAADVSKVPVTKAFLDQTKNAIALTNILTGGGDLALNNLLTAINALTPNAISGATQNTNILTALNNANTALGTANNNANAGTNTAAASTAATKTNTAPTTQNTVFATPVTVAGGGSVTIASSGLASNNVWLAPSGTTTFTASSTMTRAASGTATSIAAPAAGGTYELFVINAVGNVSTPSTATVTVDSTSPTNQNTAFGTSVTVTGNGNVTIVSSGIASNNVWLAPPGTTTFTAGNTMTRAASGTATSITAPAAGGTYKLFVVDAVGNVSTASTATVTVDSTAPTTQNTVFGTSVLVTGNGNVTIVSSGLASNNVWLAPSGTTTFTAGNTMTRAASGTATSITAPAAGGTYKLFVVDAVGNVSTASTATVTVDSTAPIITAHNPLTNAFNVAINAAIDITFDQAVTNVTTSTFIVSTSGTPITGTINHNSNNIESFSPTNALAYDTPYTVTVTAGITDPAGNALTATGIWPLSWNFRTVAALTVGGTVSGLAAGESLVLQNNAVDNYTANSNGIFTFATGLANGNTYAVTILTQPTGKTCTVSNGGGTITANVSNVSVACPVGVSLNDTGITTWGDGSVSNLISTQSAFPRQDADLGRDALARAGTLTKVGASTNPNQGFDFTKLGTAGAALTNQTATYGTTPWDCVKDNHTGLMWEIKTTTAGLRNSNNRYTWYNSTGVNDGGNAGTANGGTCTGGTGCDTEKYVADVNALTGASRICGFTDWRLPTREELLSIVDYSLGSFGKTIDTGYFPNVVYSIYWSASSDSFNQSNARVIRFDNGSGSIMARTSRSNVRLVRGGP